MKAVTFNNAKKNLRALIEEVCKDSEPAVIVSDRTQDKVVPISFEDYQATTLSSSVAAITTSECSPF